VTPESQYDAARADALSKRARLEVAKAEVTSAESALESARIRLGYTQVDAGWSGDDELRFVAERFVDEGDTVPANAELLSIVELDPLIAVVSVPERDYARLRPGLVAALTTDAYPGEDFEGIVERIAPVFRRSTRQVRVELRVANPGQRLKPGMFVRAAVELEFIADTTIVPRLALTERDDGTGVFVVVEGEGTVRWCPVVVGVREGDRAQVLGQDLEGRVVTLGQQLCVDGSRITIPADEAESPTEEASQAAAPEQ
jgi:RND family efflux transporter MFP subunit